MMDLGGWRSRPKRPLPSVHVQQRRQTKQEPVPDGLAADRSEGGNLQHGGHADLPGITRESAPDEDLN